MIAKNDYRPKVEAILILQPCNVFQYKFIDREHDRRKSISFLFVFMAFRKSVHFVEYRF